MSEKKQPIGVEFIESPPVVEQKGARPLAYVQHCSACHLLMTEYGRIFVEEPTGTYPLCAGCSEPIRWLMHVLAGREPTRVRPTSPGIRIELQR